MQSNNTMPTHTVEQGVFKKRKVGDLDESSMPKDGDEVVLARPRYHDLVLQQILWQRMIQKAVFSIVSIRFSQVAAFDTEAPEAAEASGFVVDAELGLILTNRHVVCSGPFIGEAIFHDHEEVVVIPIYRDPIHDFGFLKFDPKKIKHQPVVQTKLSPELARIGLEIRVVGNDAGEKLSILSGSISRTNRNSPNYDDLCAASSTSSGSSGSPVLNINGEAVALQAGGHVSSVSRVGMPRFRVLVGGYSNGVLRRYILKQYGIPSVRYKTGINDLHSYIKLLFYGRDYIDSIYEGNEVKRALEHIRVSKVPPRGTILVQFYYTPFDEIRRLGVPEYWESRIRSMFPDDIGALTVEIVIPGGSAYGILEDGDLLISINGEFVTKFVPLEKILDEKLYFVNGIGNVLRFLVNRGGIDLEFDIKVIDLDSITPSRYLEAGGAKLNDISYQLANQLCIPMEGVHVADQSGMFLFESAEKGSVIITSLNSRKTPNLDAFIDVFKDLAHREIVPAVYFTISDIHTSDVAILTVEKHWTKFRLCVRNDSTGYWDFMDLSGPQLTQSIKPYPINYDLEPLRLLEEKPFKYFYKALVRVVMCMPYKIEGFPKTKKMGAGLILDCENGLVLVSRAVVPYSFGDIFITFAEIVNLPAKPIFFHPTHNYVIIKYDTAFVEPKLVGQVELCEDTFTHNECVDLIGFRYDLRPVSISTTVTDVSPVKISHSSIPRYRAVNFNGISVDTVIAQQCLTGFLVNSEGKTKGVWLTFLEEKKCANADIESHFGIESRCIIPILKCVQSGITPKLRGFPIECSPLQLCQAINMGLSYDRVKNIEKFSSDRNYIFMVARTEFNENNSSNQLQKIDIIVEIDGKMVTQLSQLELSLDWKDEVDVVVIRDKKEISFRVKTKEFKTEDIDRVLLWSGAVIHEPHNAVLMQAKTLPSRVVVVHRAKGSPAYMYGLTPMLFITAINGNHVRNLDDFLNVTKDLEDETYVRVKTVSFDLVPSIISVKLSNHYWSSTEFIRDKNSQFGWVELKN